MKPTIRTLIVATLIVAALVFFLTTWRQASAGLPQHNEENNNNNKPNWKDWLQSKKSDDRIQLEELNEGVTSLIKENKELKQEVSDLREAIEDLSSHLSKGGATNKAIARGPKAPLTLNEKEEEAFQAEVVSLMSKIKKPHSWPTKKPGYRSSSGQEAFLNEKVFKDKEGGVFLDIGAHDDGDNTMYFEKHLHWKGVLVEPRPESVKRLESLRSNPVLQGCASNETRMYNFTIYSNTFYSALSQFKKPKWTSKDDRIIQSKCYTIHDLLKKYNFDHVDLMKIDIEGAELMVISSLDYTKLDVDVWQLECGVGADKPCVALARVMWRKGYCYLGQVGVDLFFGKQCID